MKTKAFILLASFLFFLMTAHAQDNDIPACFRRPLRVQTAAGKEADIADFARTIPSERFDIVGHSQGGLLGLRLAHLSEFQPRIRRIVGLGASFKGINVNYPAWLDPIAAAIGGPAAPYLRGKGFHEATIPDGVEVVSIVSTADRIVRPDNATLGHVITIDGVPHSRMPELAGPVIKALDMEV